MNWVCCQIGSREHYAIPRALHEAGRLERLVTDFYFRPDSAFDRRLPKQPQLAQRHHPELPADKVSAFNGRLVLREAADRLRGRSGWAATCARDQWFQHCARASLRKLGGHKQPPRVLFSYSYTARQPFAWAKARGWPTVLGQIDLGPFEWTWVRERTARYRHLEPPEAEPPEAYWQHRREELKLADTIVVNPAWSQEAMLKQGVSAEALRIVPLALDPPEVPPPLRRPRSPGDPLRVLFLGRLLLRKGAGELFDAIQRLHRAPVHFDFAGPVAVQVPSGVQRPGVTFHGAVTRDEAQRRYHNADVFVLPTHSDGFAITQLEALRAGVPVIASQYCARVVTDGHDGILLPEVSAKAIADTLLRLLEAPGLLEHLQANARLPEAFRRDKLAENLLSLG